MDEVSSFENFFGIVFGITSKGAITKLGRFLMTLETVNQIFSGNTNSVVESRNRPLLAQVTTPNGFTEYREVKDVTLMSNGQIVLILGEEV